MGQARDVILGTKADDPKDITLGGDKSIEDIDETKKRLAATEAERKASEQALGGTVGAGEDLRDKGIEIGEIGRVSLAEQQRQAQERQQQLLQTALGGGGGQGEAATQAGLQAQQQGFQSAAAGVGLQGRGGIAAQRQAGRVGEQAELGGQQLLQQAQQQDQVQAQNLLGLQIGQQQQFAQGQGQLGAGGALGGLGLAQGSLQQQLQGDLGQEAGFQNDLLQQLGLDLEGQTRLQELLASKKPSGGLLGGLFNAVGGGVASVAGFAGGK